MPLIDITNDLKQQMGRIPKDPMDLNNMCSLIYGEYTIKKNIVKGVTMPIGAMQEFMTEAITALDEAMYNTIIDVFQHLDSAVLDYLDYDIAIHRDTVRYGNLLAQACPDFFSSLPEAMFNMMQDIEYGLLDTVEGLIHMPRALANSIFGQITLMKNEALKAALGLAYDTILEPFIEYEEYLKDNGLIDTLNRMAAIEYCMMKPGICNRPANDFIESTTRKRWSRYYADKLMIDRYGNLKLTTLIPNDSVQLSRWHNVLWNMHRYQRVLK